MAEQKEKVKTAKLSLPVWKALTQMKLDKGKTSIDELLKEFIEREGY